jgi:HKD family nuclease
MNKKQPIVSYKFGTKQFFLDYIGNQIKKEGNVQQTVSRCHFAMTSLIFETHNGKDALVMVKNLTDACEVLSEWKKSVSYID